MSNLRDQETIKPNALRFRTCASVLALVAAGAILPAYAQTANETEEPAVEEVVVTGMKASIQSSQEIKQNASQVVDSITAVDIGALPDRSVSEALQRIPGVQLQRTSNHRDPARLSAEGGDVFVRGLNWVRTELNGRDIFSANNGRSLGFEDVSADLMAGVDVYKNPRADQVEGGLGGTVNLRTRMPFDQDERLFAGSVDYNQADMLDEGFTSSNVLFSDRWDVGVGEFGFLFSASLSEIGNRTDAIQASRYEGHVVVDSADEVLGPDDQGYPGYPTYYVPTEFNESGDVISSLPAGNYYMPKDLGYRRVDWAQDRSAYYSALQWAPSDNLTFTATALRAEASPKDIEHTMQIAPSWWNMNPNAGLFAYNDENEVTEGILPGAFITNNVRQSNRNSVTSDFSLAFEYSPSENLTISGDLQKIKSSMVLADMTLMASIAASDARQPVGEGETPNNILSGALPVVGFELGDPKLAVSYFDLDDEGNPVGPNLLEDPAQYFWASAMDHIENNEAESLAGKIDVAYSFDEGIVKSVKAGFRMTSKEAITRQSGYNWGPIGAQFWGGGDNAPFLDEYNSDQAELYTFDNFMRGDAVQTISAWFPTEQAIASSYDTAVRLHDTIRDKGATNFAGWYWQPLKTPDGYGFDPREDNVSAGINRQEEKTTAIYAMADFASDDLLPVAFDGNIGLRVVKTSTTSWGRASVGAPDDGCAPAVDDQGNPIEHSEQSLTDCASAAAFQAGYNNALGGEKEYSDSYTNVLPSLNLRFHLRDDLQLRTGLSQAMVRPSFSQTRPYSTINFDFQNPEATQIPDPNSPGDMIPDPDFKPGPIFDPANPGFEGTGNGGAPGLKPTIANQFDLSLEWYFASSSSLSGAIFYKDISDYVKLEPRLETYTYGGETRTFLVTRQTNAESGTLKGFELAYSQFFDSLPSPFDGLGIQANYTYIENDGGANTAVNPFDPDQRDNANRADLPIEGMSKNSYNFAVMYEKYDVSARLAYNYRERYLLTTSAANQEVPTWMDDYGQLDGSVFYNVNDTLKLGIQGTNLLKQETKMDVGYTEQVGPYSVTNTDRRIAIVARWSL